MRFIKTLCLLGACVLWSTLVWAENRSEVTLEGGILGYSYNEAQIPNSSSGDRFDVTEVAGSGPQIYVRLSVQRRMGESHILRGVYAPVRTEGIGTLADEVRFAGETFNDAQALSGLYEFNTYRLTYRYEFLGRPDWILGAGGDSTGPGCPHPPGTGRYPRREHGSRGGAVAACQRPVSL